MIKLTRLLKIKLGPGRKALKTALYTEINRVLEKSFDDARLLEDGKKRLMENSI